MHWSLISRIGALSIANVWASASSLIMFALAARGLNFPELGRFSLLLAASQFVILLADSGLTNLMVREIATSGNLAMLGWTLRRRGTIGLAASLATYMMIPGRHTLAEGASFVVMVTASSMYAAVLAARIALREVRRAVIAQAANGALFILLSALALIYPSVIAFLSVSAFAYVVLLAASSDLIRPIVRRDRVTVDWRRQRPFVLSAVANSLTSSADTFLLARQGATAVALYAVAQRPALAYASLSAAMSSVLLPRAVRAEARTPMRTTHLVGSFAVMMVSNAFLGVAVTPLLRGIYGGLSVSPWVVALVFAAFGGGIISTIVTVRLLATGGEQGLAVVALIQLAATAVAIVLLLNYGPVGVAAGVLAGRCVGFAALLGNSVRHDRRGEFAIVRGA